MSKRQCELECNSTTISSAGLTDMFSPKKRNNLMCSRSFRDATEISIQLPSKNKRPVTICLSQCTKAKKSPSLAAHCASPRTELKSPNSPSDGPTRINEFIFLGSQLDASSESTMQRYGITHVLNVTTNSPKCPHVSDMNFFRVPVNDGMYDKLLPHFNKVFQFIDGTKDSGGSVLVHCVAGVSRSATLVIAYLMHRSSLSFNEAYRFVKQKRPNVAPNFNFLGQLMEFENFLRLRQKRSQEVQQRRSPPPSPSSSQNPSRVCLADEPAFASVVAIAEQEISSAAYHQAQERISPGDVEFLNDLRCRCRTNSNQSTGSHETAAEILQVS